MQSYESNLGYKWNPIIGGGGSNPKDPGMSFDFGIMYIYHTNIYLISPQKTDMDTMDTHKGLGPRELSGQSFGR